MYTCEIRDIFGDIESAAVKHTVNDCRMWYEEHDVNFYLATVRQYSTGNVIASYIYTKDTE